MDTQTALPDRFLYLPGFQIMPYLRLRQVATPDDPLELVKGGRLDHVEVAYETYGSLSPEKDNAILLCHALTGDSHPAAHYQDDREGWWEDLVGPGQLLDTERFFIICPNVLGGCRGTTGPASPNPATGKPYGASFPLVTIRDMVHVQKRLLDQLGITKLVMVVGGSMGGMQALQWAVAYPDRVFSAIVIAAAARHSSQNIAFGEVGRQAVMADPDWAGGRYLETGKIPEKGLSVARMAAHITYLSDVALHQKFGRRLQDREARTYSFEADFQIESYLRHQGSTFVKRFDANAYLYLTRAMDYFDLAADCGGSLARAFRGVKARMCVVSFTSDWLFPTSESRAVVHALNASGAPVSFVEIETDKGHDAFLLDVPELFATTRGFLDSAARARGLT